MTVSQQPPLTQQWTLASQQILNWGSFNNWWKIDFAEAGEVTMISGRTGVGKSTLLDANTVLMQPSRRGLNRASNANARGRSRNDEERNIVSYMRGVLDRTRAEGDEVTKTLREGTVWSAIAQTWHNSDGAILTAFVAFFARPDDRKRPSVTRYGYTHSEFDIRDLEPYTRGQHVSRPLPLSVIKRDNPDLEFEDNLPSLHRQLWHWLGIGTAGDGTRAMDLLHRVQSSAEITSVNDLFTNVVLDEPAIFIKAAEAVEHFVTLREAHQRVTTIEDQIRILEPLPRLWHTYQESRNSSKFFLDLGLDERPNQTPFWKWLRAREYDLLDQRETELTDRRRAAASSLQDVQRRVKDLEEQVARSTIRRYEQGGARIDAIDADIRQVRQDRERVGRDREDLQQICAPHIEMPRTERQYTTQRQTSQEFEADYRHRKEELAAQKQELGSQQYPLLEQKKKLRGDQDHFQGREDLLDPTLTAVRERYARITGIPIDQLRFVAELIDMETQWEGWRTAAELTLAGFATNLLIPADRAADFRRLTDQEPTRRRIHSLTVPTAPEPVVDRDPRTLAGRFKFRDHPYAGWLSRRLNDRYDHQCVDDGRALTKLPRDVRGVTLAGQVRDGIRGSHGGQQNHKPIIGFSPKALLDAIVTDLASIETQLHTLDDQTAEVDAAIGLLDQEHQAHEKLLKTPWSRIDHTALDDQLQSLFQQREAAATDHAFAEIDRQHRELVASQEDAQDRRAEVRQELEKIDAVRQDVIDRKEAAFRHLEALDPVTDPDGESLDELLSVFMGGRPATPDDFTGDPLRQFVNSLNRDKRDAESSFSQSHDRIARILSDFMDKYKNDHPDLGTDPDIYYEAFAQTHDRNLASGVEQAKQEFTQYTAEVSATSLLGLKIAYDNETSTINKRLEQINSILVEQPYGAGGRERIRIQPRHGGKPDDTVAFLNDLARLTEDSTKDLTYDQALARFAEFESVIERIADPSKSKMLLDVRKHIHLEAHRLDEDGNLVAFHDTFGDKSGGEMQELTMFIIAAAIRYQVGSLEDDQPRFAPVFLDEGMIKADPETTARAVNVWQRLGFQAIIAVPLDKHESVMQTASLCWAVSKDTRGLARLDRAEPTQSTR